MADFVRLLAGPKPPPEVLLLALAHDLTIGARGAYDASDRERAVEVLHAINEMLHRLTSHARAVLLGEKRYPEDVLVNILVDYAEHAHMEATLAAALTRVVSVWCDETS